jgi:MFS-type transporter involved in bile tolerance (Atg22 family)
MAAAQSSDHGTDHAAHEKPEDWGWHANLSILARAGGWFSLILLALLLTATHYNNAGTFAILLFMALIVVGLIWDRQQRKTSWRR